jgi:2-methylcitrate dehydratase PrpD
MSSFYGALAPEHLIACYEAQFDAVEEALGSLVGSAFTGTGLTNDLGTRWHITENYFRLYACCNPVHGALDCLQSLLTKLRPRAEDVERIKVQTYRFASVMQNADPPNFFASKYSLPHVAAVMVVRGKAGHQQVDDTALRDPAIAALRHRVHITEDAEMSAVAPRLRPARVTLVLKDGRRMTEARQSHRGDFNEPFTEAELREKFRELAGLVMSPSSVAQVERAIDRCSEWTSVREMTTLLRASLR